MSVLYGDDGIEHRIKDSRPKVIVTDAVVNDNVAPTLVPRESEAKKKKSA